MIECSKCGSENHFDGAAFCKRCGAELSAKVAVQVVDVPDPLSKTEKIRLNKKPAPPVTDLASEEFTVEDVSDPAESPEELAKIEASTQEGGIDKLLTLYGNDEPIEQAASRDEDDSDTPVSLGIETASDYLLREQDQMDQVESPTRAQSDQTRDHLQDKVSEIQSKLTVIDDDELEIKNPMGSSKPKGFGTAMAADEKTRLFDSLSKSLHNETPAAPVSIEASCQTIDPLAGREGPEILRPENLVTETPVDSSAPPLEPEPIVPLPPVAYLRSGKLTFPAQTRILPGDRVYHNDQEFLVSRGAVDKRSWILGGVLVAIFIIIAIVQSITAPVPIKATLFGVVTNSETNEVLAGISVAIPQLSAATVTDEHGVFQFAGVPDGRYDVRVEGGLYEARFFPVVVKNNQSEIVSGSLNPILPEASAASSPIRSTSVPTTPSEEQPEFGTLKITCNVADASVLLDGKSLGKVSQVFKRLNPGARNIVVRADGFQEIAQSVNIVGGQSTELTANLLAINGDAPVEYTANDFFDQAEALFQEQKYVEAVGYYTLALAKNSTMVKAYLRRAEAHLQVGKKLNARADYRSAADLYINTAMYSQAIACYDKIIEFQPDASDAYNLRGWARISAGNYDDGLQDLQKALSFTPDDQQALFDVGKAYYVTNRYKDAEKILKKIRKHADEYPEIYGYLALTELAQGDENNARKAYDAFRKVASSAQIARMSTLSGWQRLTALAGN